MAPELVRAGYTSFEGVFDHRDFEIRRINTSLEDAKNLFRSVSFSDYRLLHLLDSLYLKGKFEKLSSITGDIQGKDQSERGGPTFSRFSLNASNSKELGRDYWQIADINATSLEINNLKYNERFSLPRSAVFPLFRRIPYRNVMDVSSLDEYVIANKFDGVADIMKKSNVPKVAWKNWREYLESRKSNLALVDRIDITAPGSSLLSYFSSPCRVWARIPAAITGLDDATAKCLCIWFNSTPGLLEFLSERMETRGGWMQSHKYIMNDMLVPSFGENKECVEKLFPEVSGLRFGSLIEQFSLLSHPSLISSSIKRRLAKAFGKDILTLLDKGFDPRERMDRAILEYLGWREKEISKTLKWVYPSVLREILTLREIMVGR